MGACFFDFARFFIPYFSSNIWNGLGPKMFVMAGSNNHCKLFHMTAGLGKEVIASGWDISVLLRL